MYVSAIVSGVCSLLSRSVKKKKVIVKLKKAKRSLKKLSSLTLFLD